MSKVFEEWLKRIRQWWDTLDSNQKLLSSLGAMAILAATAAGIWWGNRPDYAVLFSNVSPQDASAIVEHLRNAKIPYQLSANGTQVEVPSKRVYELRVEMAGQGLPKGTGAGFELFDKMSFGVTDEVQRINYNRALQSELERTLDAMEPVEKSRVHLVLPKEDLWFEENFTPSASVMLKLRSAGTLSPNQIESVRRLLAGAVKGLIPERVTIVDTQGKVLSAAGEMEINGGLSQRQIEFRTQVESRLKNQAEGLLSEILGQGKAAVSVHAEMDFDQTVKERELYTPVVGRQGLVRSEKQNSVQPAAPAAGADAGGAAGTATNLQGYPPAAAFSSGKASTSKNERTVQYEMNRTVERVTTASGTIKKLTVGIFLDGKLESAQLADIQAVLGRALGIDAERGDQIEVRAMPFNRKDLEKDKKLLEQAEKQKFWINLFTQWVPRLVLLIGALALFGYGFRSLNRSLKAESAEKRPGNGNQAGAESWSPESVLGLIRQNPNQSAEILKSWLS